MAIQLIFSLLLGLSPFAKATDSSLRNTVARVQAITQEHSRRLLAERKPQGYWFYPPVMGSSFVAQYWLVSQWLNRPIADFDLERFKTILFSEQLDDGSWYFLPDAGMTEGGTVGVTVLNYWALKAMGVPVSDPHLRKARTFILANGGMESSSAFVKILLMAFGNLDWNLFPTPPNIPFVSVSDYIGLVNPHFGLWMRPYIPPIAYLANLKVQKDLGPEFSLAELAIHKNSLPAMPSNSYQFVGDFASDAELALKIFSNQRVGHSSWGATTPATLFSMMVLDHAQNYLPNKKEAIAKAIERGLGFVHWLSLEAEGSSYRGAIFDGRYWDTVLLGGVLIEAGIPASELAVSARYVENRIIKRAGGLGFGADFEPDMDTDDTAEMIIFFRRAGKYPESIGRAVNWLGQMQNDEGLGQGGWGSFNKNNNPVYILDKITKPFRDSTEMFDPATPDVTGHILEALALVGFNVESSNSPMISAAVEYMRRNQKPDGTWYGRWGVNSLYGTSFAIVGLTEIGISPSDAMIRRGIRWIEGCQKTRGDGGFGESFLSYANPQLDCLVAPSSPTQTAWALLALLKVYKPTDWRVLKAVQYLLATYDDMVGWQDGIINGTGHPIVAPMFYPSYAKIFPLQALSRWVKAMNQSQGGRQ